MDGNVEDWKKSLWGQPRSRRGEWLKATINMQQYRMMPGICPPEPDLEPPEKDWDVECVVCRKILCVLTSATPFWFELGPRLDLLESTCPFHTPLIIHSIEAKLIPVYNRRFGLVPRAINSQIHVSRHCTAKSLRVFQEGLANCSFQLVQDRFGSTLEGHGKIINTQWVDQKVLQSWKQCCQEWHADNCGLSLTKAMPNLFNQRPQLLIDTWRMCLKEASEKNSYVALSYVWGNCTSFRTTKQNVAQLKEDKSLTLAILDCRIPKTILHAISLVEILKERYLWVDALCIVHDDEISKHQQIKNMASIYANSTITIIAAEGSHADHGIHGIQDVSESRQCKQHIFKLDPDRVRVIDLPWPLVFETTWFSRGWTYQEWLFSPRRLIFSNKRVQWECNSSYWQEDVNHISSPEAAPFPAGPIDIEDIKESLLTFWPDTVGYAKIVRFYNTRKFTYEEDILPAFAGITSLLASRFEGGFLCGLPEVFFDVALLWIPHKYVSRRISTKLNTFWLQGSQLPSWSWMGWRGEIDAWSWLSARNSFLSELSSIVFTTPTIKWYTGFLFSLPEDRRAIIPNGLKYFGDQLADDGEAPPPWTRHRKPDGTVVYKYPGDESAEFTYPVPIPNASSPTENPQQTPLLFFSAPRAWLLAVQHVDWYRPGLTLRDHNGAWAGYINLHDFQTMGEFPVKRPGEPVELVEISKGFAFNSGDPLHIDEWKSKERPKEEEFYKFYNVLFIIWDSGVAYRKGCGRVLCSVWESEAMEYMKVVLG